MTGLSTADLGAMIANLQAYIDRRAAEIAAPHIAKAGDAAGREVAHARAAQQRAEDLVAEMRRQFNILERQNQRHRVRAERAEACVVRGLAASSIGAKANETFDWKRGYRTCADEVTLAMNGILNGIDEDDTQLDVVVYDRITGDVGHREVPIDNYIVIPTGNCSMVAVDGSEPGTHVITMKGVRNP